MILLGVIVLAGLFAAASKSGKYTVPFMILVLGVIFFYKRFERYFSGSEAAWRNFRDNVEGTTLDAQLVQIEQELTKETIEWSDVLLTDSYLLWPREIEARMITKITEITRVYLDEGEVVRLLCDTASLGVGLVLTTVDAEIIEIVKELSERHPTLKLDPALLALINTDEDEELE